MQTLLCLRRHFYALLLLAVLAITVITFSYRSTIDRYHVAQQCFRSPEAPTPAAVPTPAAAAAAATTTTTEAAADELLLAAAYADDGEGVVDDDYEPSFASPAVEPPLLADIMHTAPHPRPGRTVFFHETSCTAPDGRARLNARQACAIESAARSSPEWDVFVLFAGALRSARYSDDPLWRALMSYETVHIRRVDIRTYAADTPLERWMWRGALYRSEYFNSHVSDALRYLSLYKWGGTYLDLDVILLHDLSRIPANYAGAESSNFVAAGVINLAPDGEGHRLATKCLEEFERSFDGTDWGNNGPGVITRVLHSVCRTTYPPLMTRSRCAGFEVFGVERFYAIGWVDWRQFFDATMADVAEQRLTDSYAVHVWNKHSQAERIRTAERPLGAYGRLAQLHCPRVFAAAGEFF